MKRISPHHFVFIAIVLTLSVWGCSKASAVPDKKDSQATVTPPAQPTNPTPVATQAPTPTPAPAVAASTSTPSDSAVIASVGSWKVTVGEFNDRLKALKEAVPQFNTEDKENKKLVLEELVRQALLVIDAESKGLDKEKDVKGAIEEFRRTVLVREQARRVAENVQVTPEDIQKFYDENKERLVKPIEYKVREIVVDTQVKANEVLLEVLKGADFGEMAKAHSKGKTAADGGLLEPFNEKNTPPPAIAAELLKLNAGETSQVFKGPDGFYILKLDAKTGGEQIPLDDLRKDIEQNQKLAKQQQAILDYIAKLKETIKVETHEELIK